MDESGVTGVFFVWDDREGIGMSLLLRNDEVAAADDLVKEAHGADGTVSRDAAPLVLLTGWIVEVVDGSMLLKLRTGGTLKRVLGGSEADAGPVNGASWKVPNILVNRSLVRFASPPTILRI